MLMTSTTAQATAGNAVSTPIVDWRAALGEHDRWLRTVIMARLGEYQAVDDVMQEVALAAVEQRSPLLDASKVAPWLYRLAITQALLYRRRRGRWRKLAIGYAQKVQPQEADARSVNPLDWMLADERSQLVRKALTQLCRRDAEILMLKYSEDWSYHDIAGHLGIGHSAVEARLHRARQRLRVLLARDHLTDSQGECS